MAEDKPRTSIRWGRLAIALAALALAATIGVVGALGNWYSFALGEVTTTRPVVAAMPEPSVSPAVTSPSPGGASYDAAFKKGRAKGVVDGFRQGTITGRKIGFKRGHPRGLQVGRKRGYDAGYKRGYTAGFDAGYQRGYACTGPKPFCNSLGG